jgi:AGCS family alanine or glycine:cation symporter
MQAIDKLISDAANWFALPLVGVLLASSLFFSIRLRFVQVFRFRDAIRETIASRQSGASGPLSPLQAFMTSLAATIGVGNIAGVATAIVSGGPGAMFWIWCYGFLAMPMKFAEASLGMHYRVAHGEEVLAGPMYYLRDGLKSPRLAWLYALLAGMAVLFTTPFTQPNSVADAVGSQLATQKLSLGVWHVAGWNVNRDHLAIGIVLGILTWFVTVRGVKALGRAAEKLSPLKVTLYLVGGIIVFVTHVTNLPAVLQLIFSEAFSLKAVSGGAAGYAMLVAMRYGVARGVYANEAGYGTAAVAYGTAKSQHPEQQGLAAMAEVFIISFITSTISGMSILLTGVWNSGPTGSAAVAQAFNTSIPTFGGWMVAISMFLFGYTVLIGWGYYGEQFFEYIFGPRIIVPYRWLYCLLIPFGAMFSGPSLELGRYRQWPASFPERHRTGGAERPGGGVRESQQVTNDRKISHRGHRELRDSTRSNGNQFINSAPYFHRKTDNDQQIFLGVCCIDFTRNCPQSACQRRATRAVQRQRPHRLGGRSRAVERRGRRDRRSHHSRGADQEQHVPDLEGRQGGRFPAQVRVQDRGRQ